MAIGVYGSTINFTTIDKVSECVYIGAYERECSKPESFLSFIESSHYLPQTHTHKYLNRWFACIYFGEADTMDDLLGNFYYK